MYNEIPIGEHGNLYVGDLDDAKKFREEKPSGIILCVLEHRPHDEPMQAYHIPIMGYSGGVRTEQLDHISMFLESLLYRGHEVLVHCAAGIERSPLTVAYYIAYSRQIKIDEAYKIVKKHRTQAQDRSFWLKWLMLFQR